MRLGICACIAASTAVLVAVCAILVQGAGAVVLATGVTAGSTLPRVSCTRSMDEPARGPRPARWPARIRTSVPTSVAPGLVVYTFGPDVRFVAPRGWPCRAGRYADGRVTFGSHEQIEAGSSVVGSEWRLSRTCPADPGFVGACWETYNICAVFPDARRFSGDSCSSYVPAGIRRLSPTKVTVTQGDGGGGTVVSAYWYAPTSGRAATLTCNRVPTLRCRAIIADWLATKRP